MLINKDTALKNIDIIRKNSELGNVIEMTY